MKRVIGILGGMGPEATVLLMNRIIAATPAHDDSDHVPMIVDNNTQVPSRIAALIDGTGEDPAPVLENMAQRLAAHGAEALAMPCNTAHHYANAIRRVSPVPFLDMVTLSVADVAASIGTTDRRIGMLASPAVRRVGVFEPALATAGLEARYPEDDGELLAIIRAVKADGVSAALVERFAGVARSLAATGVACLLIACSELSLMSRAISAAVPLHDSIDCLATACRDFSLHGRPARGVS